MEGATEKSGLGAAQQRLALWKANNVQFINCAKSVDLDNMVADNPGLAP